MSLVLSLGWRMFPPLRSVCMTGPGATSHTDRPSWATANDLSRVERTSFRGAVRTADPFLADVAAPLIEAERIAPRSALCATYASSSGHHRQSDHRHGRWRRPRYVIDEAETRRTTSMPLEQRGRATSDVTATIGGLLCRVLELQHVFDTTRSESIEGGRAALFATSCGDCGGMRLGICPIPLSTGSAATRHVLPDRQRHPGKAKDGPLGPPQQDLLKGVIYTLRESPELCDLLGQPGWPLAEISQHRHPQRRGRGARSTWHATR